jgi:hypothetical protein
VRHNKPTFSNRNNSKQAPPTLGENFKRNQRGDSKNYRQKLEANNSRTKKISVFMMLKILFLSSQNNRQAPLSTESGASKQTSSALHRERSF